MYFIFGGLLSEDSLRQLAGYRLFSFGDVADLGRGSIADGIALKYPNVDTFVLPKGLYSGLHDQPVVTLAIRTLLIAREGLTSATSNVRKTVCVSWPAIACSVSVMSLI